jgi:hypothetical protein
MTTWLTRRWAAAVLSCFAGGNLLAVFTLAIYSWGGCGAAAQQLADVAPGALNVAPDAWDWRQNLGLFAGLEIVVLCSAVFVFLVHVREAAAAPRDPRSAKLRWAQFRLHSLLGVVTMTAIILGISQGTGLNPGLVLFGWLYLGGPWSALFAGACARMWRPEAEFPATCVALGVVVMLAIFYSAASVFTGRDHQVFLDDLLHVTTVLWIPEIGLYYLLRPLLIPLPDSTAAD